VVRKADKMRLVKNPPRFLGKDEIDRLLSAAKGYYIYPLLETALATGMRKSELFNLKWQDIDFDNATITIQSKDDWHTKNYKSRAIALTPRLSKILLAHKAEQKNSEYVFTYKGRKIHATINKSLKTVTRKAGLTGVTLHTLSLFSTPCKILLKRTCF
jgi:integrase/recombinase XerC/integrase/recombinase XerD